MVLIPAVPVRQTLFFALLLISPLLWAQELDPQRLLNEDLKRQLPAHRYQMLTLDENAEFPVLVNTHSSPSSRGVAVLVNDISEAPLEQSALAPLVPYLNGLGWDTLLLSPPQTELFAVGERNDTDTQSTSSSPTSKEPEANPIRPYQTTSPMTEQAIEQHKTVFANYMQAVQQERQSYRGYHLVIAKGTSAAWIIEMYNQAQLPPADGIVILGPYLPDSEMNRRVPDLISRNRLPLLDIYTRWDNHWASMSVHQRRQAARKAFQPDYRQRQLVGQSLSDEQYAYMSKEIYGWLSSMGW
ncbi:hypothetical protein HMF8227_00553 [Saliniradius amylolyticus]|uniref:DUF3530 family protein n=1 Tax=Saliniradius amylolyticus TaxID=2183582 RepID=A0A2S2E0C2_9ALTE|nr:DUF3530 family protein [Saliniradius amylolyticus]AWL11049.1 hypothetical protein HMF8227_00553 [Saliniradius amylolyticus]